MDGNSGRFLSKLLRQGSTGTVYLGFDPSLNRSFVIKELLVSNPKF
jgi:serine/threonine protein kinase